MKKTLVINYGHMGMGGIENYIIGAIRLALEQGTDVLWLCDSRPRLDDIYRQTLEDPRVRRCVCDTRGHHWFCHGPLGLEPGCHAAVLSFTALDHIRALELKKENPHCRMDCLYLIPHFTGGLVYPEQRLPVLKNCVHRKFKKLYSRWLDAGTVLFFDEKHIAALEKGYGLTVPPARRKRIPVVRAGYEFDGAAAAARYRREEFRILSAGRLEFPHKGFVIGMLRKFPELKKEYPQLTYYIVGDGPDAQQARDEIARMPEEAAQAVQMLGDLPFEELMAFYPQCNLNLSVAGCATYGGKVGVPTLPARHYTYECEVYGLLPESMDCTIETKPGQPVEPYIEKLLGMTEQEYLECSRKTYDSFEKKTVNPNAFFEVEGLDTDYRMTAGQIRWAKCFYSIRKIAHKLKLLR